MGELNSMFTVTACSKGGREAEGGAGCMQRRLTERNRPLVASCSPARHGKEGGWGRGWHEHADPVHPMQRGDTIQVTKM